MTPLVQWRFLWAWERDDMETQFLAGIWPPEIVQRCAVIFCVCRRVTEGTRAMGRPLRKAQGTAQVTLMLQGMA